MIHTSSWWSLETAVWAVDSSDKSTALTPGDLPDEAALVISAFRKPSGQISPEELWIMSGKASPAHAKRSPVEYPLALLFVLILGCRPAASRETAAPSRPHPDTLPLTMRSPDDPYRMGPSQPEWAGRAAVTDTTLMFEFPTIEPDNVGCAAVDSIPLPAHRRYYWLAAADYPGARYPHNHFQMVALDFALAPELAPTRVRLDSAFAAQRIRVAEAAGEPPMRIRTVMPERSRAILERTVTAGKSAWRVRVARARGRGGEGCSPGLPRHRC